MIETSPPLDSKEQTREMVASFDARVRLRQGASRPLMRGAFAAANLARSFVWCFAEMFLAFHLRSTVGLSSAQTSLTLVILLMIGAATDLAAGFLLRRYNSSRAIVLGSQRTGAVVVAIALVPLSVERAITMSDGSLLYE